MRLADLRAGGRELLDRHELTPALAAGHEIPRRALAEAGDGHERRQEFSVTDEELRRIALIQAHGRKLKAAEIELIHRLHRHEQVLFLGRERGLAAQLVQYGSYVFTGLASGLVAFFFLIRSGAANIGTASNLEFNALQALMLGGVLITGGSSVKFRSAVIGSITMAALANGMTLWGVETLTQQLIKGFIFLIVIALTFERKSVEVIK